MRMIILAFLAGFFLANCEEFATICDDEERGRVEVDDADYGLNRGTLPIGITCDLPCKEAIDFWRPYVEEGHDYGNWVKYCDLQLGIVGDTNLEYLPVSGKITRAEICISADLAGHWAEQQVIAHEIGHALGLAHDPEWCPSIMAVDQLRDLDDCVITNYDRGLLNAHYQ